MSEPDMNMLNGMMTYLSKATPEDTVLEKLQNALTIYREDNSDKNKSTLELYIVMIMTKWGSEGQTAEQSIEEFKKAKAGMDLMGVGKNNNN